jgi:hypothetical protein
MIVSNSITNAHVGHKLSFDIDNQSEFFDVHILGNHIHLITIVILF